MPCAEDENVIQTVALTGAAFGARHGPASEDHRTTFGRSKATMR